MNIGESWKQIILTLPDNYFFELMKNYLGKIETPFNKHKLVEKLGNFLIKNSAEEKILSNLSDKEVLILTSITFITKPTAKSIYNLFLGEIPFIELCDTLKTLEEKLVIYSLNSIIYLSPLYEEMVKRDVINPGLLYKSKKITPGSGKMIWLTDGLILSFLSFMIHEGDIIKSSGAFKKRAFNRIETLFPHLLTGEEGELKLNYIRRILHNLNLVRIDNSSLSPRMEAWKELINLDKTTLFLYLISAATLDGKTGLSDRITTTQRLITSLPKDRAFFQDNLKKFVSATADDRYLTDTHSVSSYIENLVNLNILVTGDDGSISINPLLDIDNINPDYGDKHTLILQPNFDITYKPWITLKDGFEIALFSNLKKMDLYTEMSLTKESFTKGLTLSTKDSFVELLVKLTGKEVPDNILLTLDEWEKSSKKAIHYNASVLILDVDKEFILKETGVIDDLILLNPGKGIYLIKHEDYDRARELLSEVDIIPIDKSQKSSEEYISLPGYIKRSPLNISWEQKVNGKPEKERSDLENHIRNLSCSKEEKEDLRKRIKRGIIFTREQIKPGITKTEFSEARGVNYQNKVRLIEVALKSTSNRLEINYVREAEIYKELILPTKIEKVDEKRILHGLKLPEETPFSIDIGKISLVKRIQTTLF